MQDVSMADIIRQLIRAGIQQHDAKKDQLF